MDKKMEKCQLKFENITENRVLGAMRSDLDK